MRSIPTISRYLITSSTALRTGVISLTLLTGLGAGLPAHPAAAAPLRQGAWILPAETEDSNIIETRFRGGGVRRGGAVGVRGGAAWRGHGAVVRRGGAGGTEAVLLYAGAVPSHGVVRGAIGGRQVEQSPLVRQLASSQRPPPQPGPAPRPLRAIAGIIQTLAAGRVFGTCAGKGQPGSREIS
jgi:hypothetical protein